MPWGLARKAPEVRDSGALLVDSSPRCRHQARDVLGQLHVCGTAAVIVPPAAGHRGDQRCQCLLRRRLVGAAIIRPDLIGRCGPLKGLALA